MAQNNAELLALLYGASVEFVIIGGVAAVAHGAGTVTYDFDITAPFTVENLRKLMSALAPYEPRDGKTVQRLRVEKSPEELSQFKNLYLETKMGADLCFVARSRSIPPS
ncbi:MAG: hypothetical protein ACT4TC_08210, partial [Myxococcaceae bacterium]